MFPHPPEWHLDLDFHALLAAVPSKGQRAAIRDLHARLTRPPWDEDPMDGHCLLLEDARGLRHPGYGVLNSIRILRSVESRDVVFSKADSAEWGRRKHPEWRDAIDAAVNLYTRREREEDAEVLDRMFREITGFVCDRTGLDAD